MVMFCIPKAEARIARITGGFPNPKGLCGQLLESTLREMPRVPAPGLTQVPNYSFSDFFLYCLYH